MKIIPDLEIKVEVAVAVMHRDTEKISRKHIWGEDMADGTWTARLISSFARAGGNICTAVLILYLSAVGYQLTVASMAKTLSQTFITTCYS